MSGMFSGGFMGSGGKETKTTVTSEQRTNAVEQDLQIGGNAQNVIAPGAAVSGGGGASIIASPESTVTAQIYSTGYSEPGVQHLLDSIFSAENAGMAAIGGLADSFSEAQAAQGRALTDIISATQAPEQTSLTTLMPLLIVGVLLYMVSR